MTESEGFSDKPVQANGQDVLSDTDQQTGNTLFSSPEHRFEKAFDKIENFLNNRPETENDLDTVIANLDVLITCVKDALLQVEQEEQD